MAFYWEGDHLLDDGGPFDPKQFRQLIREHMKKVPADSAEYAELDYLQAMYAGEEEET
ncbi:hypothetical protein [Terriglobus aquaticus]|uniref:Uncharacterized protein n=1 Tax=Terriglobus aquaticus TaxID=940139 RepID=A0ABW9KIK3_9BACT|nr:hypothetical protein [Terriglobus aquaticus]